MSMLVVVDCTNCRAQLHLRPGAKYIRCALCQSVTRITRTLTPPTYSFTPSFSSYFPNHHYQPSHQQYRFTISHLPPCQPPVVNGQKRAVICGILYKGSEDPLKGCVNDAKCMRHLLMTKFNFPESSIIMLTEEEKDPLKRPTKYNIRRAMHWLVKGCQPGDSLVFYFSGHGSQQKDNNEDEIDEYEGISPLDVETEGLIIDDEINARIVRPLPHGVKLHAIIDACHSGTVLDLPYLCIMYRTGQYVWEDHRPRSVVWKGTNGGEAISFSGCDDHEVSYDTSILSKVTSTGAMTFSFIKAIECGRATTYGHLLTVMRSTVRKTGDDQEPQLSSNEPFDVYDKIFTM